MSNFIIEKHKFNQQDAISIESKYLKNYPIVYILYNKNLKKKPKAYIGQTFQANRRLLNHEKNKERKDLTNSMLIGHKQFNQSATYNIETNLINHFIGDEQFELQNVSQRNQPQMHNYFQKLLYDETLFAEIWNILLDEGLAKHTLDTIQNKDIYKISPYKALSESQIEIKEKIINYCRDNINSTNKKVFFLLGEAGTGKSVVLSSLYNTIQDLVKDKTSKLYKTKNYLLVNHSEMLKTYHSIASGLPNLQKSKILKPTTFINDSNKGKIQADISLVDEGHLLLTRPDKFNSFEQENQLDEIIKHSKITIVVMDPKQFLKLKSQWNEDLFEEKKKTYNADVLELTDQFRMQASDEVVRWIDNFVENKVLANLPLDNGSFDFRIMESPDQLKKLINLKNHQHSLSRIVSTFDYEHKKDGAQYLVDSDGLNMPWNTTNSSTTWAERPETINEVGSIYTVQGFDLNYVGVVLGPSIDYDFKTESIVIYPDRYKDTGGFTGRDGLSDSELIKRKEEIVLNSVNILLKRAVKGLYIYAVNDNLHKKLLSLQEERDHE